MFYDVYRVKKSGPDAVKAKELSIAYYGACSGEKTITGAQKEEIKTWAKKHKKLH
jgi:hypothetical protein